jgi:hypothetical protein
MTLIRIGATIFTKATLMLAALLSLGVTGARSDEPCVGKALVDHSLYAWVFGPSAPDCEAVRRWAIKELHDAMDADDGSPKAKASVAAKRAAVIRADQAALRAILQSDDYIPPDDCRNPAAGC